MIWGQGGRSNRPPRPFTRSCFAACSSSHSLSHQAAEVSLGGRGNTAVSRSSDQTPRAVAAEPLDCFGIVRRAVVNRGLLH